MGQPPPPQPIEIIEFLQDCFLVVSYDTINE